MRKVFANKWFILAFLLTLSLSIFSFAMYREAPLDARNSDQCYQRCCKSIDKGEFFWEIITGHLHSVSFQ